MSLRATRESSSLMDTRNSREVRRSALPASCGGIVHLMNEDRWRNCCRIELEWLVIIIFALATHLDTFIIIIAQPSASRND
ncbi:hypothetical protein EVAR_69574_1 [Eumeta japonica]|uniref:Uncharacterized protein n=1 Tax=Eumeta variegata TaxID=151549 RepID=A0A4C2A8G9_EUMVA|nr:hypothetical protein EVAR_69574_1 [Eumeta japonica]